MPQLMSDILISRMPSVKWVIVVLSLFAGIVSAFVDNVATVLMIAPVALAFSKQIKISPVPSIICIAISSNLQGAATLVGDTTSILLAKSANLDFSDFFVDSGMPGMFWIVEAGAVVSAVIILFMFRKENHPIEFGAKTKVEDKFPTFLLAGTVICLIAVSFIPYKDSAAEGAFYKPDITNGIICILFFLVGIIYRVVNHRHRQECNRAGVEQFSSCMHEGHTVADSKGADTVHHSGTKSSDESICHRYGRSRSAEDKCVFRYSKADTDNNRQTPLENHRAYITVAYNKSIVFMV